MEEIIKGEELIQIMNLTYDELTGHEYLNRPGYCGFFMNDECLYVFGGSSLLSRLRQELGHCKDRKIDRSMRYILLNKHLQKAEWRVLEFVDHSVERRDYWITYYNNPIFNIGSRKDAYHVIQEKQFEHFVSGKLTLNDLKALADNPESNRLIWTPGTELQTVRKKGLIQGVYMIRNKNNDRKYIGSSTDVEERWKQHIRMLKNGEHHSYKLQQAYNAVKDINAFEFSLIENVSNKQKIYDREQYWIDYYDVYRTGYNCTRLADGTDKHNNRSQLHDEDEVEKFKLLYFTYTDCISIPDSSVKRIVDNQWPKNSVKRMNDAMEWYLSRFNIEHTAMSLVYQLNEETNKCEWFMLIDDVDIGMSLFRAYIKYFIEI